MSDDKFREVRDLYTNWENIRSERFNACVRLTRVICGGFREYIGAPKEYSTFSTDVQKEKSEPYTFLAKVSPLDENDLYHFTQTKNPFDALTDAEEEGYLVFGLGLTVDREINAFPKSVVWYRIGLRFDATRFLIRLYNSEPIRFSESEAGSLGNDKLQPFYDQMFEFAKEAYRRDPWERRAGGAAIGFVQG